MACKLLVMGFRGSPVRIRPSRLGIRSTPSGLWMLCGSFLFLGGPRRRSTTLAVFTRRRELPSGRIGLTCPGTGVRLLEQVVLVQILPTLPHH